MYSSLSSELSLAFVSSPLFYLVTLLTSVLLLWVKSAISRLEQRHSSVHPPGPKGLSIVGNVLDVPATSAWLVYEQWARTYGKFCQMLN